MLSVLCAQPTSVPALVARALLLLLSAALAVGLPRQLCGANGVRLYVHFADRLRGECALTAGVSMTFSLTGAVQSPRS